MKRSRKDRQKGGKTQKSGWVSGNPRYKRNRRKPARKDFSMGQN